MRDARQLPDCARIRNNHRRDRLGKLATTENIAKALKATHITILYKNNITNSISCHIN